MLNDKIQAKHLLDLKEIKTIFDKNGIECSLIETTNEIQLHSLICKIESDTRKNPWILVLSFIPTDEDNLDFIKLLQCYVEISPQLSDSNLELLKQSNLVNKINNTILFGKYSLLNGKIAFRYVMNLPQFLELEENFLQNFITFIQYNLDSGSSEIGSMLKDAYE